MVRELADVVLMQLPKISVALLFLFAAWRLVRLLGLAIRAPLGAWPRSSALVAVCGRRWHT